MWLEGGEEEAVGGQPSGRAEQNGIGGGLGSLLDQTRAHGPAFGVLVIDRLLPLLKGEKKRDCLRPTSSHAQGPEVCRAQGKTLKKISLIHKANILGENIEIYRSSATCLKLPRCGCSRRDGDPGGSPLKCVPPEKWW